MSNTFRCIFPRSAKTGQGRQSEENDSLPCRPIKTPEKKASSSAVPAKGASSSSSKSPEASWTEVNVIEKERSNRTARKFRTRPTAGPSQRQRRVNERCSTRPETFLSSRDLHSENEENDEELAALARLRVAALSHLTGPCGKERDPEGYVTLQVYRWHLSRISRTEQKYFSYVVHRLVRIDTLPDIDQNCIYERALYQATIPQIREQYKLHLQRLENIRRKIDKEMQARRDQRLGNIDYDAWCYITSQWQMARYITVADRAVQTYMEAQVLYDERIVHRTAENGVKRLLERCEAILTASDENFRPCLWRSPSSLRSSRWKDGKRGWTGLEL